jgi:hypothetical protein
MDERDGLRLAEARRPMTIGLAAIFDRAFGRLDNAAERLDEGRFAGAVLAEQSQNFSGMEVERYATQRGHAAEPLDDIVEADERRAARRRHRGHFRSLTRGACDGRACDCYR